MSGVKEDRILLQTFRWQAEGSWGAIGGRTLEAQIFYSTQLSELSIGLNMGELGLELNQRSIDSALSKALEGDER